MSLRYWTLLFLLFIGQGLIAAAQIGSCGPAFLPLATDMGAVRMQVILTSLGFEGCGHLTMCHLLTSCNLVRNESCSFDFQLWHSNALGGFALKSNSSFQYLPLSTGGALYTGNLSIPLDMEFTTGDVVGFGFSNDLSINRFEFRITSASNHSYLQWMTSGTTLSVQDATTVESKLPVLSMEGTCHPCPSSAQMPSVSDDMSTSLQDAATPDGPVSLSSNGNNITTATDGATSASSSAQPLFEPEFSSFSPLSTSPTTSTLPAMDSTSTVMPKAERSANSPSGVSPSSLATDSISSSRTVTTMKVLTSDTMATTSVVLVAGGLGQSDTSAALIPGVVVGVVLAVVLVVVVVAIVMAVCLVWRKRKNYNPDSKGSHEVPFGSYIAANSNAVAAQYEMPFLHNAKDTSDGVYDVPSEVGEPCGYEVPTSSTLPSSYEVVSGECAENEPFSIYGVVPTVAERRHLKEEDEDTAYQKLAECQLDSQLETSVSYSKTNSVPGGIQKGDTPDGTASSFVVGVYEMDDGADEYLDEDTGTYWSPGNKEEEIYAQMSHCKYQEIPRDKVKMSTKLGEGQFGEVYKAVLKSPTGTNQDVAVKFVKKGAPQEERVKLLQEAAILGQFKHRHVVSLYGVVTLGEPKMMIMELLTGDLKSYLEEISETDSLRSDPDLPSLLLQFCKQVADGLACLAGKSFVHRDIAARNILLDQEHNCKISDFGMTREVESKYYMLGKGTMIPVRWSAPEVIMYKKYTTKSDIWSYGMLMYEIWSLGHKPFENNSVQEMVRLMDDRYCLPPPPGCPREVYSVMVDCWNPAHSARPTVVDILGVFCKSERVLLGWRAEDTVAPLSRTLGAPLIEGETLHRDLQNKYKGSLAKQ